MKKIIAILLITILLCGAMPMSTQAAETAECEAIGGSVAGEAYLAPITVSEDGVYQSGEEIAAQRDGDTLLMDVEAVAQDSAEEENGTIILPTEEGEILFTAGSDEALVTTEGEESAVPLSAAVTEEDGTLYAPVEDLASLCQLETFTVDGDTVYAKPYQTKTLVVSGEDIPACGAQTSEAVGEYTVLSFATERDTKDAYEQLAASDGVSTVSCENVYTVSDYTPDDFPLNENLSWGADYIDSPQLTEYVKENNLSGTVTVGIVDTGINTKHSFIKDRIAAKSTSCVAGENTVEDKNGHGSHVAGIIADNTPDNVKILAVKGLDANGQGTDSQLAAGIRYAADNGAAVINMSFGGLDLFGAADIIKSAVKYAYDKGVILVAAAGNESRDASSTVPASSPYCITVAATDALGEPAFFSNYGNVVDVAAPGVNINSSYKKSGAQTDIYYRASGTSMATPFVVAACADAQLLHGKMSFAAMKKYVTSRVTPYGTANQYYGTGIISLTDYSGVQRSSPVVFSEKSGYYSEAMTVSLLCADSGATIYYTTDGSAPSKQNGTLYDAPIAVADDTQLKAVAYTDGKYKSKTTKALYQYSDRDLDSNYTIDEKGVITRYKGDMTVLSVPDTIHGKRVTGIASNAFRSQLLLSIVLPDTIREIPAAAFYNCSSLTTVIAPKVTKIGNDAFSGCNLKRVTFGKLTAIGDDAFNGNVNLNEDSLDLSAVTTVGDHAFYRCPLTVLDSAKLTDIGAYAFSETNLVSVKLDNMTTLKEGVFQECTALESVTLPKVTAIGKSAFQNDIKLENIVIPQLTAIGERAFYRCYPLSSLATAAVSVLGSEAFVNTAIKSLDLSKLNKLPKAAFAYMQQLQTVKLPAQSEVPTDCFMYDTALESIPSCFAGAKTVGESAFENAGLTAINLPEAVTVMDGAFKNCTSVKSVNLPRCAFFGANGKLGDSALSTLSLPKAVTFGSVAGSTIRTVQLPCAVSLGANAFNGCGNLQTVEAPNVQSLGANAFYNCSALKTLCIQNFDGSIPSNCFYGCRVLQEVFLPCATAVGYNAFKECTALKTVDLSAVKTLDKNTVFASSAQLQHLIAPQAITPSTHPSLENSTLTLTNRTGETVNILCGDALFEQVKNGKAVKLPAGSAVRVLYNGTFTGLKANNNTVSQNPITFDFTLTDDTTLTTAGDKALNRAVISGVCDVSYGAAAFTPAATVKLDGKTLKKNTDYTLTMYNNTEGGTATAVFTGIGSYHGVKAVSFKIKPVSIYKCTISAVPDQLYTGKPITPAVTVKLNGHVVTDYTVEYRNNTAVGEAKIMIISGGTSLLDTTAVTFKIKKKETTPPKNGWKKESGKWYYYTNNVAAKGWKKLGSVWYYFNASGVMQTGWQKLGGKWYYFNGSGAMVTGWQKLSGKWYYFNGSGAMVSGWQQLSGKWYYFNGSGAMVTGWQKLGGKWYYFETSGAMRTASLKQGGKTYYFNASGACTNP